MRDQPLDHERPERIAPPAQSDAADAEGPMQRYRVVWMGKDGAYEQRQYLLDEVIISSQDQSLIVATKGVNPLLLLALPVQRVVQVELVAG